MISFGSLFTGIGGMDLGLVRAGLKVQWQCEISAFCRKVLEVHFPDVPRFKNIRRMEDASSVDIIAGGFPCQDHSQANTVHRARVDEWSLWHPMLRIIQQVRPRFALVENAGDANTWVPAVRHGLGQSGYWSISVLMHAGTFGAPHTRPRWFVVADSHGQGESLRALHAAVAKICPLPRRVLAEERAHALNVLARSHGLSARLDRSANQAIGNAVHPAVAQWFGRWFVQQHERGTR